MDTLCACIYIMGFTLSLADAIKTRKEMHENWNQSYIRGALDVLLEVEAEALIEMVA